MIKTALLELLSGKTSYSIVYDRYKKENPMEKRRKSFLAQASVY